MRNELSAAYEAARRVAILYDPNTIDPEANAVHTVAGVLEVYSRNDAVRSMHPGALHCLFQDANGVLDHVENMVNHAVANARLAEVAIYA